MIFVQIFVLHFAPFMIKLMVQHTDDNFLIFTDLDQLTNYSSVKLSSFLQTERNEVTIAHTFTRVDYLRIK